MYSLQQTVKERRDLSQIEIARIPWSVIIFWPGGVSKGVQVQAVEIGEAAGDDEQVVVGQAVEVGAGEGCQGVAHDSAAAEEAHGLAREVELAGEGEGLEGEVGLGEFPDESVEVGVGAGEV